MRGTRFARVLTDRCSIMRAVVETHDDLDQVVGEFSELVEANVSCHLAPLQASDDMIIAGPRPVQTARLFLPAETDVQMHDRIIMSSDDSEWTVTQPPETQRHWQMEHHVEAIVERLETAL